MGKDLNGKELGEGISQRKDGNYQARYTNKLGQRICFYSKTAAKAKEWLEIEKAKNTLNMNAVDKHTTLDEWFYKWITIYKYGVIRPNTERHYKHIYSKHISPYLGKKRIAEITHLHVTALINDLDKLGYKYETQNKVRILLQDMYNRAIINDLVYRNPAKGIKVCRDEKKEPRFLSPEEQKLFLDYSKGTFYDNMFIVSLNTGLRPGEIYALKENDLDFEKKIINVDETLTYQKLEGDEAKTFHFGPPKTESSYRQIKMTRACEYALKKQLEQNRIIRSRSPKMIEEQFKDLIFITKFGTPINAQIESDAIRVLIDGINLMRDEFEQLEYFTGHCFRHTFASNCYRNGFSIKVIQKLLGHATTQMTEDLYIHLFESEVDEDMEKLSEAMDQMDKLDDTEDIEFKYATRVKNNVIQFPIGV